MYVHTVQIVQSMVIKNIKYNSYKKLVRLSCQKNIHSIDSFDLIQFDYSFIIHSIDSSDPTQHKGYYVSKSEYFACSTQTYGTSMKFD
jgi:hypothetical protein